VKVKELMLAYGALGGASTLFLVQVESGSIWQKGLFYASMDNILGCKK
jgi:hypothetical protein